MTRIPRCNWRAFVVTLASCAAASLPTITFGQAGKRPSSAAATTQATTALSPSAAAAAATAAEPKGTSTSPASSPANATTATAATSATAASAPVSATAADANEKSEWKRTVDDLAALLISKDLPGLQKELRPVPVIRPFGSDALQTHERLLGATTGSTLLGAHAYDKTPTTLASDLAGDFSSPKAAEAVPQSIREGMVPPTPEDARRANETAAEWLVQVLQPHKDDVTAVIVLWPQTRGRALAEEPKRATFVLVKGEKVDGAYVFRQISFGDPLESPQ